MEGRCSCTLQPEASRRFFEVVLLWEIFSMWTILDKQEDMSSKCSVIRKKLLRKI